MTLKSRGREGSLDSRCSCQHGSGSQPWVMPGQVLNLGYTAHISAFRSGMVLAYNRGADEITFKLPVTHTSRTRFLCQAEITLEHVSEKQQ